MIRGTGYDKMRTGEVQIEARVPVVDAESFVSRGREIAAAYSRAELCTNGTDGSITSRRLEMLMLFRIYLYYRVCSNGGP